MLQSVRSGLFVGVGDASKEAGARILQWDKVEGDEGRWKIAPVKPK